MRHSLQQYLSCGLFVGLTFATPPTDPSPAPSGDLICHTNNAAECYPRIFQPTKDFQVIHDDQDIPPGLHVRMDIYSGIKEARLNIPIEGDLDTSEIPTEQAMVIVEQPEQDTAEVNSEPIALRDKVNKKPPAYEAAGKILPPREPDGGVSDAEEFQNAVSILSSDQLNNDTQVLPALSALLDLSHDIYYGVELMKNKHVVQNLMLIMLEGTSELSISSKRRRLAAGILASSVQNNPTALKEAQVSWRSYLPYPHSPSSSSRIQAHAADQEFLAEMLHSLHLEPNPTAAKAKVSALSGLIKSPKLRDVLLELDGLEKLLELFNKVGEEWDIVRKSISQFVMDNFLDEDMGAEVGKWPRKKQKMDYSCALEGAAEGAAIGDECWLYHLTNFIREREKAGEDDEWSKQFLQLLRGETDKLGQFVKQEL